MKFHLAAIRGVRPQRPIRMRVAVPWQSKARSDVPRQTKALDLPAFETEIRYGDPEDIDTASCVAGSSNVCSGEIALKSIGHLGQRAGPAARSFSRFLKLAFARAQYATASRPGAPHTDVSDSVVDADGDFIFDSGMEATNGATCSASATKLAYATTHVADTTSNNRQAHQKDDTMNTSLRNTRVALYPLRHAAIVATLLTILCASAPTIAQTCNAPGMFPSMPEPVTGTTCGGEQLGNLCGGMTQNPGPNYVLQFVLHNPSGHILISGTQPFSPVMYLSHGADSCEDATCAASGDSVSPISLDGLPPGSYRLIVAAQSDALADTCGVFSVTGDEAMYAGEADVIFEDGFDSE